MKYLVILLIAFYSASARKEEFDGLEELMNNPKLLAQLEKRLGALLSADEPDSGKSDRSETELPCNASTGTLNATQARCSFETDNGQIIRTTDSINNGAKFVGKMENIECAKECVMECCNNPECDTAVYQDKDDHKCYLFNCDSNCVFDPHSNYRVSYFKSRSVIGNPGSVPDGNHRSHETELENLGSDPAVPEPLATVPPTEESLTTTVRPALGESCRYFGPLCEDQHAECYMRECSCRAGYHEKYGICRKHCRAEEFECDNEGLGAEATQCVHSTYRCDGKKDCEDRSDEYNCPKIDEENHPGHITDSKDPDHYKPKGAGETSDHADKTPVVAQPSKHTEDKDTDTQGAPSPDKNSQDSDTKSAQGPKVQEVPQSHDSDDIFTTLAPGNDHQVNTGAGSQLPDEASKNSNTSESEESKDSFFTYFSAEEKVESYTAGSQGPIVALALGLAITLILLIFVGCRLRTVKRRLRKGRALHSNEADYLINGMYL